MRARDLGFKLEEIRDLLALVDGGIQTCGEVQAVATRHLKNIRDKISDMRRIERVLSDTVSQCTGDDVPECAVIDALIRAT
jgi:MerR family mercuric resistance operon transcriptional regulator